PGTFTISISDSAQPVRASASSAPASSRSVMKLLKRATTMANRRPFDDSPPSVTLLAIWDNQVSELHHNSKPHLTWLGNSSGNHSGDQQNRPARGRAGTDSGADRAGDRARRQGRRTGQRQAGNRNSRRARSDRAPGSPAEGLAGRSAARADLRFLVRSLSRR